MLLCMYLRGARLESESLEAAYALMSVDAARELAAAAWSDALIADADNPLSSRIARDCCAM